MIVFSKIFNSHMALFTPTRILCSVLFFSGLPVFAQTVPETEETSASAYLPFKFSRDISKKGFFTKDAEWYFSLGVAKTYYANSDINVNQSAIGNEFTVHNVEGHDEIDDVRLYQPDIVRIGRFIDDDKMWALELGLDHVKYSSTLGQTATVTGTNSGGTGSQTLSSSYFSYMLHNGLNHLMVDLVYRRPITAAPVNDSSSLAFIGKVGAGIAYIHPYIDINGKSSNVGDKSFNNIIGFNSGWWRIVGVSTSVEAGLRYVISKPWYLELTDKTIFTSMNNIPVYQGTASQNLWSNEVLLSIGYTFDNK
jgi:hypothetical protein